MDEVFIRIRGKLHYLWRAVDQEGRVLDILVQSRRNADAAKRFFCKLLRGLQYVPRVIVTDKLLRVANRNHRRAGSQSSDGRAQNDCTGCEGPDPQSLRLSP